MRVVYQQDLFTHGACGYEFYRVPGIVQLADSALIAYCEARQSARDWGAIDIACRRCTPGSAWTEQETLVRVSPDFPPNPVSIEKKLSKHGAAANNPVMIADHDMLHFLYCVDYYRCFCRVSIDGGATFSESRELTQQLDAYKSKYPWRVIATGPGHGVRTLDDVLLVPVWLSIAEDHVGHRPSRIATFCSFDHGGSWFIGQLVPEDPRFCNPSECSLTCINGEVLMSVRHEGPEKRHALALSRSGFFDWRPYFTMDAREPICMSSIVHVHEHGTCYLAMLDTDDPRDRHDLTLWASKGDVREWRKLGVIQSGSCGYADMIYDPIADQLVCLYCRGAVDGTALKPEAITIARIDP